MENICILTTTDFCDISSENWCSMCRLTASAKEKLKNFMCDAKTLETNTAMLHFSLESSSMDGRMLVAILSGESVMLTGESERFDTSTLFCTA